MTIDREAVLAWFDGKMAVKAAQALDSLAVSLAQGFWVPKTSRSVRAALNKCNVAAKYVRNAALFFDRFHEVPDGSTIGVTSHDAYKARRAMEWGNFDMLLRVDVETLHRIATGRHDQGLIDVAVTVRRFIAAMRPVVEALNELDATRPPPVITQLGVSPTVTATLEDMKLDLATIQVCPMRRERIERTHPVLRGVTTFVFVVFLDWPAGTEHGTSPRGSYYEGQCEACGHRIKNPFNWVPLVAEDQTSRKPRSLWVGTDCAHNLFGIKITGPLELGTPPASTQAGGAR